MDWGEVNPQGETDTPADGQGSVDLRDNQLDELPSQNAPASSAGSARCADPDSLEGATVVSQASTDMSQSVLAGLALNSDSADAPNSDSVNLNSNSPNAPKSDSVNLNNCTDLPSNVSNVPLNNEMEVIDSNCNSGNVSDIRECEMGNSNDNNGIVNNNVNGNPRNWRLISLLNVDYKLAATVLAGRLLKVIHLVVADDQTCGVPGRCIGKNLAFLGDVVHYASFSGQPIAILSLDQEKAFDRVDWGFMRSTLLSMGFGQSFVKWVDLFYTDVSSAVC